MDFILHPKLAADTAVIADWPLSRVLLMNDKRFPWLILVPRCAGVSEIFDLDERTRVALMGEIARAGEKLKAWARARGGCDKINIGSLGNMVPQLHIHVVARVATDAAWPAPVWGAGQPIAYDAAELSRVIADLRAVL
jgi:diadenosine tetraphosphate (Ap4A) HIT family hydrolase